MKLGPHFCAVFNRLTAPGKERKHLRRCKTCKEILKVEWARRLAKKDDGVSIRDVAPPLPNEVVDARPIIEGT
jgi:hypothetical protein